MCGATPEDQQRRQFPHLFTLSKISLSCFLPEICLYTYIYTWTNATWSDLVVRRKHWTIKGSVGGVTTVVVREDPPSSAMYLAAAAADALPVDTCIHTYILLHKYLQILPSMRSRPVQVQLYSTAIYQ